MRDEDAPGLSGSCQNHTIASLPLPLFKRIGAATTGLYVEGGSTRCAIMRRGSSNASTDGDTSMKSQGKGQYNAMMHTTTGDMHHFQWTSQYDYLNFLKQMASAQRGKNVSFSQTLSAHYPSYRGTPVKTSSFRQGMPTGHTPRHLALYPTTLSICAASGTVRWSIDFDAAVMTISDKQSRQCEYRVYLCDIAYIYAENMFDFSKQYLLEMEVSDVMLRHACPDGLGMSNVTISMSSPHGEVGYCSFHSQVTTHDNESNKRVMHLFVSAPDIMSNVPLQLSVHIYDTHKNTFGEGEMPGSMRCIGASVVSLPQLVWEAYSVPPVMTTTPDHCDGSDGGEKEGMGPADNISTNSTNARIGVILLLLILMMLLPLMILLIISLHSYYYCCYLFIVVVIIRNKVCGCCVRTQSNSYSQH